MAPSPLTPDDERTLMAALAIADGVRLDWPALGALPGGAIRGLQRLERIAAGHRCLHETPETPETSDPSASGRPAAHAPSDLRVTWGPLVIQDKVGHGASGDVYRAWDPRLQRQVALKVLRDQAAHGRRAALIDEGRRLARLRHPNIVTVLGAEDVGGRVGIWMEFLDGPTLADEVRRRGPLQAGEVARVGVDICRALAAVHDAQLLHRDVKAQNVMRDGSGRLVLGDFGTSLEVDRSLGNDVPAAGTPLYLAPEVLAGLPPSVASDLYAVGVLLYHLLTGAFPVEGQTLADVRRGHRDGRVVPLAQRRPDVPEPLRAVVASLLDANASGRPNTAAEVEAALAPLAGARAGPGAASTGLGVRRSRSRGVVAVASAVCLLGLALALWPLLRETRRQGAVRPREGTAMSYQIASPACAGVPASNGMIACVEYLEHLRERGAAPPPPLVLFNPDDGQVRVLREARPAEYFTSAVIAPDGAHVAYVAQRAGGAIEVRRLSLGSGHDTLLVRAEQGTRGLRLTRWATSDGRIEARVWRATGTQALLLLSPRTGAVEGAFGFPAPPQLFARSPDGSRIAFDTLQSPAGPERDIVVCAVATSRCVTAIRHPAHDSSPAWTPDGRLVFLSDRSGVYALWAVTVGGLQAGPPVHLRDTGRARPTPLGFDAHGTLYYELWVDGFDVFGADVSQGESRHVRLSPRAVDINKAPAWSPDGQWLAYVSQRGPFEEPTATRLVVMREAESYRDRHPAGVHPELDAPGVVSGSAAHRDAHHARRARSRVAPASTSCRGTNAASCGRWRVARVRLAADRRRSVTSPGRSPTRSSSRRATDCTGSRSPQERNRRSGRPLRASRCRPWPCRPMVVASRSSSCAAARAAWPPARSCSTDRAGRSAATSLC